MRPVATKSIPSLIKWTGSKRKQAPKIASLIPEYNRYFEPFLGGRAMLFLCAYENAVASDIYKPLIELWKMIQKNPQDVIYDYEKKWNELNIEYKALQQNEVKNVNGLPKTFYESRDSFNKTHNPLDLNFIMRTCVNGIVRFNSNGEFNNSFHLSRQGMKPALFEKNVLIWHKKIQGVNFQCKDLLASPVCANKATGKKFTYFQPKI